MATKPAPSERNLDEEAALRSILEGTATQTGEGFFAALVENLARALHTHAAWVTEYLPKTRRLRALAFWVGGEWIKDYEFHIDGTPCAEVIDRVGFVHFPDNLISLYPNERDVQKAKAVSYMGVPLLDLDGTILGHLAVMDQQPMPAEARTIALFQIFADRAAAELRRVRAEREIREREEKLARLVDSAMDAIIELDRSALVTRVNAAAEKTLGVRAEAILGRDFAQFIEAECRQKLSRLIGDLDARPEGQRYLWIPGGLVVRRADGSTFPAEATLSRFEMHREPFHTVILRNVNERLEAERTIQSLRGEAEYLREELTALHNFDRIIGRSDAILQVLRDVQQVAETDATVLIEGETGTGKELVARAVHTASSRRTKPFVKVNCAAIPATLIESEFFGHEQGAFTGATRKREGRFALADQGTIFLDEIGELPIDLQAKLLRVLQEGEFEPVGSSRTRTVNVRVIAATNRDLKQEAKEGKFREDLYYRLNVFPLAVPPLRDRREDVPLLAQAFVERFAQRMGRRLQPLTASALQRLKAYPWPGNVRELENVIERAVITAREGHLNLDRALPGHTSVEREEPVSSAGSPDAILTAQEIEDLERRNIIRALEATDWRVAGEQGAARRLAINPSTLTSRMKTLGIKRPPKS